MRVKTIYYQRFKIIHDSTHRDFIKRLHDSIEKNPIFLKKILPSNITFVRKQRDYTYININDIDKYIEEAVKKLLEHEDTKKVKGNQDIIDKIYFNILLDKYDINNIFQKDNIDIPFLYSLLAISYYNDSKEFTKCIMNLDEVEKGKLLDWARKKSSLNVHKKLLLELRKKIDKKEPYLAQLLPPIYEDIKNQNFIKPTEARIKQKKTYEALEYYDLDLMIKRFLIEIDSSGEWVQKYLEAKDKKQLVWYPPKEERQDIDYDSKKLNIIYQRQTIDFIYFIQSFIRWIMQIQKDTPTTVRKFPEIYYTEKAIEFLDKNGYSEDAKKIKELKENDFTNNYLETYHIMKKIGTIKEEGLPEENQLLKIEQNNRKDKKNVYQKIDYETRFILMHGKELLQKNSYIIGEYLKNIINSNTEINQNEIMKYITENINTISLEELLNWVKIKKKEKRKEG